MMSIVGVGARLVTTTQATLLVISSAPSGVGVPSLAELEDSQSENHEDDGAEPGVHGRSLPMTPDGGPPRGRDHGICL